MKKLFLIILLFWLFGSVMGQVVKGYRVETKTELRYDTAYVETDNEPIGSTFYDQRHRTIGISLGNGVVLQVGQEQQLEVVNETADTIKDGRVVGYNGVNGRISAIYASKDERHTFFAAATEDIPPNDTGIVVTISGAMHDINTGTLVEGLPFYLDTMGYLTNDRPSFPDYVYPLGTCIRSGTTDGVLYFRSDGVNFKQSILDAFDGAIRETFDFRTYSDGTNIYGVLTNPNANYSDKLTLMFSDGWHDFAVPDTIQLIAGTATNPQQSWIYIDQETRTLQSSTTGFPTTEHAEVAKMALLDAASTQADGALRNQNTNNHLKYDNNNGHIVHIGDRIRILNAQWENGVALTVSGTPTNLYLSTTSGEVWQMHKQVFVAQDMSLGDDIHIPNHPTTPYLSTTNLNTISVYSDGSTWNNEWQNLVIWGVCNKTGEVSHLMCNLSSDGYTSEEDAIEDANSYSNYTIPRAFRGVGFLIARITIRRSPAGYTYNPSTGYLDLRGYYPNNTAGGGTGSSGITEFTQLDDTPNSYIGQAYKFVRVASGETALEFVGGDQILLTDFDTTGFTLEQSQITNLVDTISALRFDVTQNTINIQENSDSITAISARSLQNESDIDLLQSSSHPAATLTTDDATVLSLNESTQAFDFNSSNIPYPVTSVNGQTGTVGLGLQEITNVNNTTTNPIYSGVIRVYGATGLSNTSSDQLVVNGGIYAKDYVGFTDGVDRFVSRFYKIGGELRYISTPYSGSVPIYSISDTTGDIYVSENISSSPAILGEHLLRKDQIENGTLDADFTSISINGESIGSANPTLDEVLKNGYIADSSIVLGNWAVPRTLTFRNPNGLTDSGGIRFYENEQGSGFEIIHNSSLNNLDIYGVNGGVRTANPISINRDNGQVTFNNNVSVNGTASGSDAYQDGQFVTYGQDADFYSLAIDGTDINDIISDSTSNSYTKTESDNRYLQSYTETQTFEDVLTLNNRSAVNARFEAEGGSGTSEKGLEWYLNYDPTITRSWLKSELTVDGRDDYYMQDLVFGNSTNLGTIYPPQTNYSYETFRLSATGQLKARLYGSGNFEDNSPAYISGYDATGKFIEIDPDSIGGNSFWSTDANGIAYDGNISVQSIQDIAGTNGHLDFNSSIRLSSNSPSSSLNGMMYYNSGLGKFRAYEDGEWKDLITSPTAGTATDLSFSSITSSSFNLNSSTGNDVSFSLSGITASGGTSSITLTSTGSGAPVDATYLTTTSNATLTNEIVVGTTPSGDLGGTWGNISVDNDSHTHGSSTISGLTVSNLGGVSGTPSSSVFLRGDNKWATVPSGGGDVYKVGTPADNYIGVWTGDGTIEGTSDLQYSAGEFLVNGYTRTSRLYLDSEYSSQTHSTTGGIVWVNSTDNHLYFTNQNNDSFDLTDTGSGGISDGDKGDITVSNLGTTWNIDAGVVGSTELASTAVSAGTYTNPSITVDTDGRITSAQSNTGQIGFSGAKVYCNSTQTATSSGTILSFGGEEYDISGMHSTTNSSRITMPTVYASASIVNVKFSAQFKALGDITGDVELLKNGSVIKTWDLAQTGLTGQLTINVSENFVVAADDYLEIRVTTSSNSTSATTTALRPTFSVDLITIVT